MHLPKSSMPLAALLCDWSPILADSLIAIAVQIETKIAVMEKWASSSHYPFIHVETDTTYPLVDFSIWILPYTFLMIWKPSVIRTHINWGYKRYLMLVLRFHGSKFHFLWVVSMKKWSFQYVACLSFRNHKKFTGAFTENCQ